MLENGQMTLEQDNQGVIYACHPQERDKCPIDLPRGVEFPVRNTEGGHAQEQYRVAIVIHVGYCRCWIRGSLLTPQLYSQEFISLEYPISTLPSIWTSLKRCFDPVCFCSECRRSPSKPYIQATLAPYPSSFYQHAPWSRGISDKTRNPIPDGRLPTKRYLKPRWSAWMC